MYQYYSDIISVIVYVRKNIRERTNVLHNSVMCSISLVEIILLIRIFYFNINIYTRILWADYILFSYNDRATINVRIPNSNPFLDSSITNKEAY